MSLAPKRIYAESADTEVPCRVCGAVKRASGMLGHIGHHKEQGVSTIDAYCKAYGEEASRDFFFMGSAKKRNTAKVEEPKAEPIPERKAPKAPKADAANIEDSATEKLTSFEQSFYDAYTAEIFGQIDRDPAQWPMVMNLALDMIELTRLRRRLDRNEEDPKLIMALTSQQKNIEERIRAQMKSLGISREEKLKNRAQIRSTPFALLSGYLDELERMSPQQLQAMENEERKLLATMTDRIQRLYVSKAADIEEEDESESISKLDIDRIVADANIEL